MIHSISKMLTVALMATLPLTACKDTDVESMATGSENNHEYVDMGLSVKWATKNIGANAAQNHGDHFAWGETSPKESYDISSYKFMDEAQNLTKYTNNQSGQLDLEDDAAHVLWGSDWRMPSEAEWNELRSACEWTWTVFNGENGFKVKAANGNWIFLPVTGYYTNESLRADKSYGYYWTNEIAPDAAEQALCENIFNHSAKAITQNRIYGFCIRAVR